MRHNRNREIPNTEKEEVLQALKDVQTSIDAALRKNTLNIRTDIFDLLPVFIAKSGNPYLIAAGILGILISIYGSVNEFYYRMRVLNPKIQDAHKIYNRYMSEDTNEQGINRYMDIATDTVETVIEGVSFFLPQLILASNLLNFLVEIPIDVGSREKYYEEGRKIADMIKTIKKSDT